MHGISTYMNGYKFVVSEGKYTSPVRRIWDLQTSTWMSHHVSKGLVSVGYNPNIPPLQVDYKPLTTLPETNITPENGWLEY